MTNLLILFEYLVALWIFATIILGLLWYIWSQQEAMKAEREGWKEERAKFLEIMQTQHTDAARERKDLYDRLQAGTLPQYKEHQGDPDNDIEEEEDTIVDMETAKEEIMADPSTNE